MLRFAPCSASRNTGSPALRTHFALLQLRQTINFNDRILPLENNRGVCVAWHKSHKDFVKMRRCFAIPRDKYSKVRNHGCHCDPQDHFRQKLVWFACVPCSVRYRARVLLGTALNRLFAFDRKFCKHQAPVDSKLLFDSFAEPLNRGIQQESVAYVGQS